MGNINFESLLISIIGFSIVFLVLIILWAIIAVLRIVLERTGETAVAAPATAPTQDPGMVPAKGSLGEIKLYDVPDRIAALIMAIVADEMKAPLNELRFISIRKKK
ncbi:MAG: OadG family protein [Planctomycetota bacterium]|jgi:Na+-transporting methylmalonyl-CoA/oxaloacetate decarboxylase gamma subunit|nr:OadG family protein [Planctomycetota bacterium]